MGFAYFVFTGAYLSMSWARIQKVRSLESILKIRELCQKSAKIVEYLNLTIWKKELSNFIWLSQLNRVLCFFFFYWTTKKKSNVQTCFGSIGCSLVDTT